MELLMLAMIGGSIFGAYKLTPKPATVSTKEKPEELIPW